jgi:hypothetical protein
VTNLDLVELLLEEGADPNSQDHLGRTALRQTLTGAPSAAKCLLNWPSTDVNITTRSGASILAMVRQLIPRCYILATSPDNPDMVQEQIQLPQWREVEKMLVERGAHDNGIATLE